MLFEFFFVFYLFNFHYLNSFFFFFLSLYVIWLYETKKIYIFFKYQKKK